MSNENEPAKLDDALDLSALNLGPAWARDRKDNGGKKQPRREGQGKRDGDRGPRKGRPARGDGGGYEGGGRRPQRDDRRQGGRPGQGNRQGGGRRDFNRQDNRPKRVEVPAPEGFTAQIQALEEGIDGIAAEITKTARTHSVFEIAWMILGSRDHFRVCFQSEKDPLYQSQADQSTWLTEAEALQHFWTSGLYKKYYEELVMEVEKPAGNFQAVARCGISGEILGPPNYHAYQKELIHLHQERFGNMSFEDYKAKIRLDHSEEAIEEWLKQMTQRTQYKRVDEAVLKAAEEAEKAAETPAAEKAEAPAEEAAAPAEDAEAPAETAEAVESTEDAAEEEVVADGSEDILVDRKVMEADFLKWKFSEAYRINKRASVVGSVNAKNLSPGLLTLLKSAVFEERRYPGNLASFLCRQLTGRHLAVFKWSKKLHCGPSRPKSPASDLVMAERPQAIFNWVTKNPGGDVEHIWKELWKEEVTEEEKHLWFHDMHWLINEGFVLLLSDGTLHVAKEQGKTSQPAKKAKSKNAKGKKPANKSDKANKKEAAPAAEKKAETAEKVETPAAEEAKKADEAPAAEETKQAEETPVEEAKAADETAAEKPE
ncbi:hypothetical protein [Persicirhabdus sediminis]|uniref:Uncharacterized protein n=1 Tax=Persicirhabdus sediminis TaxID=454144 RepID=A0A8J7MGZ5_9BACT|nr:hypothetical protein [Persicirhabdus sediminis]MBK1792652.1 hypothetical protein [Persicirhabdus sediminis]